MTKDAERIGPPSVCVVNVLFDDRYGGPQKRVIEVAGGLSGHGVQTILCLPAGDGNAADVAREAGVPVVRIDFERVPRPGDLKRVLRWAVRLPGDIRRFLAMFRRECPDVAHVSGAFFIVPAVAAKLARVPLVWHLNDTVVPARVAPVFGAMVRMLADRVIVEAEAVARHYAVSRGPYEVIYAPVDIKRFLQTREERGREASSIGIVANWNPLKGLEHFVRAAALVRERLGHELKVVFAGARLETYEDYARRIDDLIEELDLRSAVHDHGFVGSIETVLADLDVLVLSSISEASPMVVLEAMAAGVPVVATDVGGVREMLLADPADPAGVVVPPADPEAIAAAVLDLLKSPEEAARMGRGGRLLAAERFSLETCVRRHLKVYRSVTGGGPRGAGS